MIINFPSGLKVDVIFDDTAHSYVYALEMPNGQLSPYRPTHGITAPLKMIPKEFLQPWASKVGVEALLNEIHQNPSIGENIDKFHADKEAHDLNLRDEKGKPVMSAYRLKKLYPWFSKAKGAYKTKSKEGQDLGTWLHESIEEYYKSNRTKLPVVTPEVQGMWDSFMEFDESYSPIPGDDGLEFLVYSPSYGYSGQGDFKGMMGGGSCIGDWKTTNRSATNRDGISVDYFFQLGGLAQAEFERTGKWVDDLFIANFDKEGGDPRVIWASDFGLSPSDCAVAYITIFMAYHTYLDYDYKFSKR